MTGSTPDHEGVGPSFSSQTRQDLGESQGTGLLLENVEERHGFELKDGEGVGLVNADRGQKQSLADFKPNKDSLSFLEDSSKI